MKEERKEGICMIEVFRDIENMGIRIYLDNKFIVFISDRELRYV